MWPFSKKPTLDDAAARWHVDNFCWLLRNLAHTAMFRDTRLVLPAPGFFDVGEAEGHARAAAIFKTIKTYAGMADWPVQLIGDVATIEPTTDLIQPPPRHTSLGLFMRDHSSIVRIAYAPRLLNKPVNLIATLAHEMAHYLVTSIEDTLPCKPEKEEFLTDQTACFMGFGVFMANNIFEFQTWQDTGRGTQGWRAQRSGYLPERDLVFDLALFLVAKDFQPDEALPWLKPHLAGLLKRAMKEAEVYRDELKAAIANAYTY